MTHSLNFPSFENVLFFLDSWRIFSPDTEFQVDSNFLSARKNFVPHPSGFHNFWWEISCHSSSFSPISKVPFISHYFQDIFPLVFISLAMMCLGVYFFWLSYLMFTQLLDSIGLCFLLYLEYFQPLLLWVFFQPLPLSPLILIFQWYKY